MRARSGWIAALAAVVVGLAAWRAACVLTGPDVDTDAYAHHMIARAILADPRDLAVHWVWLPLFHYLQVPLVWCGGTMNDVRWLNVALSAALPVALFAHLARTTRAGDASLPAEAVALLAAAFTAGCPIVMQMGTTAQPEPLFALLVLGVVVALERRWTAAAAAMLGAAVLLRYEAWAVLAVVGVGWLVDVARAWRRAGPRKALRAARAQGLVVVVPVALILVWAALRRPVDGRWFGFLGQTHEFANDALQEKGPLGRGVMPLLEDVAYYPVYVAVRVLGPVVALVPFGVARTVRQQGWRFVLLFSACLGFVSLSWITRSSLGLDRHFVVVVPLYATFGAQGAAAVADFAARVAGRRAGQGFAARAGRAALLALALVVGGGLAAELVLWMRIWRGSIARGWPERASLGAYLRSLPASSTIFCDDATLEILSGLDRRRFDRHWIDDPHTWELVDRAAGAHSPVYVATWARKLHEHRADGAIVFAAGAGGAEGDDGEVEVMRVEKDEAGRRR